MTDENGQLTTETEARRVTDTGETWGGIKPSRSNATISQISDRDTNVRSLTPSWPQRSPAETFLAGLCLNARSPYTLDNSLVLQSASTMSVQDGVSLRISEGATITVNGVFDAVRYLSSTGYGARWGGLTLGRQPDRHRISARN